MNSAQTHHLYHAVWLKLTDQTSRRACWFCAEVLMWIGMEQPIVQILVVVVIRNMKSISAEADKVISKMAISWEWVDPKREPKGLISRGIGGSWERFRHPLLKLPVSAKGNPFKITELHSRAEGATLPLSLGLDYGNVKEVNDSGMSTTQRYLLCSNKVKPGVGWVGSNFCSALMPPKRVVNQV